MSAVRESGTRFLEAPVEAFSILACGCQQDPLTLAQMSAKQSREMAVHPTNEQTHAVPVLAAGSVETKALCLDSAAPTTTAIQHSTPQPRGPARHRALKPSQCTVYYEVLVVYELRPGSSTVEVLNERFGRIRTARDDATLAQGPQPYSTMCRTVVGESDDANLVGVGRLATNSRLSKFRLRSRRT
ncbi:hypothetical protein VTO42DRAFT_839 [Malbranchea cinnamomea]